MKKTDLTRCPSCKHWYFKSSIKSPAGSYRYGFRHYSIYSLERLSHAFNARDTLRLRFHACECPETN